MEGTASQGSWKAASGWDSWVFRAAARAARRMARLSGSAGSPGWERGSSSWAWTGGSSGGRLSAGSSWGAAASSPAADGSSWGTGSFSGANSSPSWKGGAGVSVRGAAFSSWDISTLAYSSRLGKEISSQSSSFSVEREPSFTSHAGRIIRVPLCRSFRASLRFFASC